MSRINGNALVRVALLLAMVCLLASAASADTFIRQVTHSPELQMMGQTQPARTDTGTIWIGEDRVAMITDVNRKVVVRADKGVMYMIDNSAKKYTELPVDFGELVDSMVAEAAEGTPEPELEQAKQMMKQMMGEVKMTVTPTDSTMKIREWDTRKYISEITMNMGTTTSEMWVTEDADVDFEVLWSAMSAMLAILPGFDDMVKEMSQIKGIPIKTSTTTTMMGQKMTTTNEVLEISTNDAPDGTYDVPEGYTKESFGKSMPGMGN